MLSRRGRWAGSTRRRGQRGVLVDAAGAVGAAAVAEGEPAPMEMAEEFDPFLVGRGAVFLAGAQFAAAGDEGAVAADRFFGVDSLVTHGDVDVLVTEQELGDVRRHAVQHRFGGEILRKSCGQVERHPRLLGADAMAAPVASSTVLARPTL